MWCGEMWWRDVVREGETKRGREWVIGRESKWVSDFFVSCSVFRVLCSVFCVPCSVFCV